MAAMEGYDNQGMLRSELDINGKPLSGPATTWYVNYMTNTAAASYTCGISYYTYTT